MKPSAGLVFPPSHPLSKEACPIQCHWSFLHCHSLLFLLLFADLFPFFILTSFGFLSHPLLESPLLAHQQLDFKTKLVSFRSVNWPVALRQTQAWGCPCILQQRFPGCTFLPGSIGWLGLPICFQVLDHQLLDSRHYCAFMCLSIMESCSDNEWPFWVKEKAVSFGRRFQKYIVILN